MAGKRKEFMTEEELRHKNEYNRLRYHNFPIRTDMDRLKAKEYQKARRLAMSEEEKERIRSQDRARRIKRRDKANVASAKWRKANPDKQSSSLKRCRQARRNLGVCVTHPNEVAVNAGRCARCSLLNRIGRGLRRSLQNMGAPKISQTEQIIGCSIKDFQIYIESKFLDEMSWNNMELWHLDHIVPLATANTSDEIIKLNHYTNLQPLWAADNMKKNSKIDGILVRRIQRA